MVTLLALNSIGHVPIALSQAPLFFSQNRKERVQVPTRMRHWRHQDQPFITVQAAGHPDRLDVRHGSNCQGLLGY
jgi:hypothetical protein